jgi:anti-anti-sigma factor
MDFTKKNISGYCIINIEGRIDTTNFISVEKEINGIIDSGEINFILNCKGLNYISSSGLRVFLILQKKLMSLKGKLYLCEMQPIIKEIFDISGFSTIFKIFNTESEAIEA